MTSNQLTVQLAVQKMAAEIEFLSLVKPISPGFIQENVVIFLCGSEDSLVEYMVKKSQGLVE